MSLVTKIFADNLGDLIAGSKKSIRELSEELDISTGSLSKYQNDSSVASINALAKIAKYFNVSADWLLGLSTEKTIDADVRRVCTFTGLSEDIVKFIVSKPDGIEEFNVFFRPDNLELTLLGLQILRGEINRSRDAYAKAREIKAAGKPVDDVASDVDLAKSFLACKRYEVLEGFMEIIDSTYGCKSLIDDLYNLFDWGELE